MGSCCSIPESERIERVERPHVYVRVQHPRRGELPASLNVPRLSEACYSEFLCHCCGRYWNSTLAWYNSPQQCKNCHTSVPPRNQREVRQSDLKRTKDPNAEHPRELCQKCQQLGYYCGIYNSRVKQVQGRPRRLY